MKNHTTKIGNWNIFYSEENQLLTMYTFEGGYKSVTTECELKLYHAVKYFSEDSFLNWLKGCF